MISTKEKFEKVFNYIHRENKPRVRAGSLDYALWVSCMFHDRDHRDQENRNRLVRIYNEALSECMSMNSKELPKEI